MILGFANSTFADAGLVLKSQIVSATGSSERAGTLWLGSTLGEPAVGHAFATHAVENAGFWHPWILALVGVGPDIGSSPGALGFALLPNAPNPLTSRTILRYSLPPDLGQTVVSIRIHDVTGRLVRKLDPGTQGPGVYAIAWDGRTDSGVLVDPGIYFCSLGAGHSRASRKLVVVR